MSDRCGEDFLDELLQLSSGSFDIPEAFGMTAEDDAAAIRGLSFDDGVFDINNASGLFDDDDDGGGGGVAVAGSGAAGSSGEAAAPGAEATASGEEAARGGGGQRVAQKPASLVAAGLGAAGGGAGGAGDADGGGAGDAAGDAAGGNNHASSSSSGCFSDDDTEKDVVHTSDGNMSGPDGDQCSVIGSVDGEGPDTSSSSCMPSSDSSSSSSDDGSEMSIVSCEEQEDDEDPCIDKPTGLMLAAPDPDDAEGDFICSKVRQRYEKAGDTPGEKSEVFEVVFKDGSKKEYGRKEVLLYKQIYDWNEGERGCFEFFFKV